jgi:plasmid stability protein
MAATTKTISVRNIPDDLWRKLRMAALEKGQSVSKYLVRLIAEDVKGKK